MNLDGPEALDVAVGLGHDADVVVKTFCEIHILPFADRPPDGLREVHRFGGGHEAGKQSGRLGFPFTVSDDEMLQDRV